MRIRESLGCAGGEAPNPGWPSYAAALVFPHDELFCFESGQVLADGHRRDRQPARELRGGLSASGLQLEQYAVARALPSIRGHWSRLLRVSRFSKYLIGLFFN